MGTIFVDNVKDNVGGNTVKVGTATFQGNNLHLTGSTVARVQFSSSGTGLGVGDNTAFIEGNDDTIVLNAAANGRTIFQENGTERARFDTSGNMLIGKTATGTGNTGCQFEPSGTGVFSRSGDICMVLNRETNAGECVSIRQGGTAVGGIDANSSSVDFNTSSDYRLKENVTTSWDATTRLKQLKPVRFSWKVDSKSEADTDGFLAHEVSSVVPQAISGDKDAVDADGNPKHQGIDHSKLVALLVKTVQELETRIATLESK